jgi:hypothetical protein
LTGTSSGSLSDPTRPVLKPSRSSEFIPLRSFGLLRVARIATFLHHTLFGTPGGTTIVMEVYNNKDILMVAYEDLSNEDKDIINKAMVEFQNKCLMSYIKSRDNMIIQKYPLPRVLMHRQSDTDEADDRFFFVEAVNNSVHGAMLNHNTTFLNTFHNTIG